MFDSRRGREAPAPEWGAGQSSSRWVDAFLPTWTIAPTQRKRVDRCFRTQATYCSAYSWFHRRLATKMECFAVSPCTVDPTTQKTKSPPRPLYRGPAPPASRTQDLLKGGRASRMRALAIVFSRGARKCRVCSGIGRLGACWKKGIGRAGNAIVSFSNPAGFWTANRRFKYVNGFKPVRN